MATSSSYANSLPMVAPSCATVFPGTNWSSRAIRASWIVDGMASGGSGPVNTYWSSSARTREDSQGHLVFGDGVAQQVQNKLKGFVPHGTLLAWHVPHEPKPCLKVDFYDSTAAAPH